MHANIFLLEIALNSFQTYRSSLALLLGALVGSPVAVADKPNIIVILSDDAGWADFGFQDAVTGGTTNVPTPRLDALAASGVRFTDAYTASVCSPSRAMLTTGMYGGRFGYESNINAANGQIGTQLQQGLPLSVTTIWEQMQSVGYATAAVGKWHLGAHTNNTSTGELGNRPQNQGIESFEGIISGSRSFWMGDATGDSALRRTTADGAGGSVSDQVIEGQYDSNDYVTDVFGDLTVDYIRDNAGADKPFFMYSSFTAPHTPLQATAADLAAVDALGLNVSNNRRTQIAMQVSLDRNVGKILDAVNDPNGDGDQSDSIADNTLIIFMNDNGGDCCDTDPNFSSNSPLRNGKGSQYEGGLRVPMIIAGAGVSPAAAGTLFTSPVQSIDVLPTAFAAGGGVFQPGETIDGVNLIPFINGETADVPHESLFIRRASNNQSGVRVGDWKLMYRGATGAFELYNVETDINESNNVAAANPEIVSQLQRVMTDYDVQMDKARYDLRAEGTNQFDELRFRENSSATWSASGAWVNNQNGATATMTEVDGYANAVLVFRNRAAGDYTATNDLTRVGGLEFLANRIELNSGQPLTAAGTATINGRGVLLAKSLAGVGPEIKLDASQAAEVVYTYDIALDVNLYDDLTISGDGNQMFAITGALREYRPGRSVTKTGEAQLTLGGAVDLSADLDLQGGLVEFTNGNVRGNLLARSGATVRVGGVGIVPGSGPSGTPPPIVTAGLDLHYDAAGDISGDASWLDLAGNPDNLAFLSSATPIAVSTTTFPALSAAYRIPVSGGASGLNQYFESPRRLSEMDATFEVVFNVVSTAGGADQVLFEAGGENRGVSMVLNNGVFTFDVDGDAGDITIDTPLSNGWHHAVGVIDIAAGDDTISLFINNSFVGSAFGDIDDWAGGNISGVGAAADSVTGVSSGVGTPFSGDIAIARFYANTAFGAAEVDQNFQSLLYISGDPGVPAVTLAVDGAWLLEEGATLELDLLDPANFDRLAVTGAATLAGGVEAVGSQGFAPNAGDEFAIVSAGSVSGEFASLSLPPLAEGLMWQVKYAPNSVALAVTIAGDYNADGVVDAADYTTWRDLLGQNVSPLTRADGDGDGQVTEADLDVWRAHFGAQIAPAVSATTVPEPAGIWSAMTGILVLAARHGVLLIR